MEVQKSIKAGLLAKGYGQMLVIGALIISVVAALVASFTLAGWAELSGLNHGLQHVLLFSGGMGVGVTSTILVSRKKED
jgi:hypothetical protein